MPPSICSVRSAKTFWNFGRTSFQKTKPTTTSATADHTMSYVSGMRGLCSVVPSAARIAMVAAMSVLEDEAGDEADQREGLGECNTEEHGGTNLAGHLGLADHAFDCLAHN